MLRTLRLASYAGLTTALFAGSVLIAAPANAVSPPSVTSVSPTSGRTSAGVRVTITGARFQRVTKVVFGTTAGTSLSVVSTTKLLITAPAHAAGLVYVRVTTAYGTSPVVTGARYTYVAAPAITTITPTSGGTGGGTRVTITGARFSHVTKVLFGSTVGTALSVSSTTKLQVTAPAHTAGLVEVRVTTSYGTSPVVTADHFTYVAPPAITSVAPTTGTTLGGTRVTITGARFDHVVKVVFGSTAGTALSVTSTTKLLVTTPPHAASPIDIRVVTSYGTSPVVAGDRFTYYAPVGITAVTPGYGAVRGGTDVTVIGTNFVNVTSVTFGGIPGTMSPMYFPTTLRVTPPAHAAGTVDVVVHTATGSSAITSADHYTYQSSPNWGPSPTVGPTTWHGRPSAVSCPTETFCVLADDVGNVSIYNGTTWSAPTHVAAGLTGVSCTSDSFCIAVADDGTAWTYDGASWSPPLGAPIDTVSGLTAVSCTSETFCVAVDRLGNEVTYNGSTWSEPLRINPLNVDPENGDMETLNAVSCTSPAFCMAVSQDGHAITFDGSTWSAPTPLVPMGLVAVSCASPTFCVAVHAVGNVLVFDGTTWSQETYVDQNGGTSGVSCPSDKFCVVVDGAGAIATFDGVQWSDPANPLTIDNTIPPFSRLGGISCPTTGFCATFGPQSGNVITYLEGTWSAPVKIDHKNSLVGVSCASADFCVAIDNDDDVFMYNGVSWSDPVVLNTNEWWGLNAVSCTDPTFCMVSDGSGNAYRYDGVTWSGPTLVDPYSGFTLSCTASDFCMGVDGNGNAFTYNGTTWTDVSAFTQLAPEGLQAVSCTSATSCVALDAVGNALTFNGSTWSAPVLIDPPNAEGTNALAALSCIGTMCVAVDQAGFAVASSAGVWSAPVSIAAGNPLSSVSCASSSLCFAVGDVSETYTFNGTTWSSYATGNSLMTAVSATPTFAVALGLGWGMLWY